MFKYFIYFWLVLLLCQSFELKYEGKIPTSSISTRESIDYSFIMLITNTECKQTSLPAVQCRLLFINNILKLSHQSMIGRILMNLLSNFAQFSNPSVPRLEDSENKEYISEYTITQYGLYDKDPSLMLKQKLVLCISHYQEQLNWLNTIETPFIIVSKTIKDSRVLHVPVNQGNEVSSYLLYILTYYHNLPEYTLFLHGHNEDWHQLYNIQYILNASDLNKPYSNINNWYVNDRNINTNTYMKQLQTIWFELFQEELGDMPATFREKCCAQFFVHRDRIQLRSYRFYKTLYEYVISDIQDDASAIDGYHSSMSYMMEFIWHYIYGEAAVLEYPEEAFIQLEHNMRVYI